MSAWAYYNEIDEYAAAWLYNLMAYGAIAPGFVDTRSIEDVRPDDLREFTQCHFFAGIGGWSYALRLAGVPDAVSVWTGSCPCQPFSAAGKGDGFSDERHLWPAWQHLIAQCQPPVVFGEQVASKAVDAWIDLVHADLEGMGYAFGSIPFPAAGVGSPHIRDRNYWVAHAGSGVGGQRCSHVRGWFSGSDAESRSGLGGGSLSSGLGNTDNARPQGFAGHGGPARRTQQRRSATTPSLFDGMADTDGRNTSAEREQCCGQYRQQPKDRRGSGGLWISDPNAGHWAGADWLSCRDGKWRPVEPGTFPLAHGVSGRVGRLRAYGNAIVPTQAAEFIKAALDAIDSKRLLSTRTDIEHT